MEIAWRVDSGAQPSRLVLDWRETGGPRVTPPARRGFGSRLLERGLAHELGGEVTIRFDPAGVRCHISAPLDLESEEPADPRPAVDAAQDVGAH